MDTLETVPGWRLRIEQDDDPISPREDYDHLESVVTVPDRDYFPVDKHGGPLADQWDRLVSRYRHRDAVAIFTRYASIFHGAVCVERFIGRTGPLSVWYLTREVYDGPDGTPDPLAYLKAQIQEYESWCEGDVWGYIIEREVRWTREDDPTQRMTTWEVVDSCWGFIGREYAETEAREAWQQRTVH